MQFLTAREAQPLRVRHAFELGMKSLDRHDYQRAWLAGVTLKKHAPEHVEGYLLYARVAYRKAQRLPEPLVFLLESKKSYLKVLKLDPGNEEAQVRLDEIERLGISEEDIPAWRDRCLGREQVAFKDCQLGYHPDGTKSVVIWTLADYSSGTFQVVDSRTGKIALEGMLEKHGLYAWKRHHWVAEFSAIKREGEYCLKVAFENGPRAASHPFPVCASVYTRALQLSLQGFFNHRCGQGLPWRKGCHEGPPRFRDKFSNYLKSQEDGLERLPAPVPVQGGWHDGGNWERHATNMVTNLYALLLGHQYAPKDWHDYGEAMPDVLVEARYAVDYYLSCLDLLGTVQVSTQVWGVQQASDGRCFLTGLYVSHKDRSKIQVLTVRSDTRGSWIPWYARLYAASLALFALQVAPHDKALSGRCLQAAILLQAYHREPDPGETLTLSTIAAIALGDMYLWQLTRVPRYARSARQAIRAILAHHDADGFSPVEGIEESALYLAGFFPQIALCEFVRVFPDDPLCHEIVGTLEAFMLWIERLSSISPFRHMMEYRKETPRNLVTGIHEHGPNAYFGYVAIVCLLANRILGTDRYTAAAERQVQWIFGRNPVGICFMGAAGYRNGSQHLMDLFDHGREFNQVPGFVSLGVRGIDVEGLGPDYPFFPTFDVDGIGQGYSTYWTTCEGGGMTEGPVHAALAMLDGTFTPESPR